MELEQLAQHYRSHSLAHNSKTPFFDFLETLDPERKDNFLRALTDLEIMGFSASEEEFRMISDSGADVPENFFENRPLKAVEVGAVEDRNKEFRERLKEIESEFPPKSLRRLKQIADKGRDPFGPVPPMPAPTNITITIQNLREKAASSSK